MSTSFQTKFRQSTDIFTPNLWYVYRDYGNNNHELVTGADSREEAQKLVNGAYMNEVEATINSIDNQQEVTAELLEKLHLGYAITIHKSQGSQWPNCFVMLPNEAEQMIDQTLLYTASTRPSERLVLMGEERIIEKAILVGSKALK